MRVWSLHPKYLDRAGLVAMWRETLLAQKCILHWSNGMKMGYMNHSQLTRFKATGYPMGSIACVLLYLWRAANERQYKFDDTKIINPVPAVYERRIPVTRGQVEYEFNFLQTKLSTRDPSKHVANIELAKHGIDVSPAFRVIDGPVENWEHIKLK